MTAMPLELTPTEARIVARAREFDLGPLLRLLDAEGYPSESILFESNPESVSAASLVEAVTFHAVPHRRVVVTLNLGLLGANALVPSYFLEVAEQSHNPDAFFDFIRFFDHRLLEEFVRALHPERDSARFGDWERTKGFYFRMTGVGSVATLQWLFQLYFPELRAWVTPQAFRHTTSGHGLRTGLAPLDGSAALGNTYTTEAAGFRVELHADSESDARGEDWPWVVERRLAAHLWPLLSPLRLRLEVGLSVAAHAQWARLTQRTFLGYERLQGETRPGHRLVIFHGDTGDSLPARARASAEGRGMTMGGAPGGAKRRSA
ncbi:type VI secretion system baseplate subunit TssG [Archangium primigenium]|uniref:type VI secretion system baseplate subunit TssG n=1 Tax=[Archangium] primigenium TaxID=2792470 RepID=UPI001957D463|nr:type VI secretion system baseplate subunit TssG [Archangium primigenium]MBM7118732.1 type VI secretion system baseplate subunit TssG [Archangium primigenium]